MKERRKFFRFQRQRKAQYFLQESGRNKLECIIIDVSRKGMNLLLNEKINLGSTICLEIPLPGALVTIKVNGTLKWIEERGNDFIAGIELTKILDDEKFRHLLIGYSLSRKKIDTKFIKEVTEAVNAQTEETFPSLISKQPFTLSSFKKLFSLKSVSVSLLLLLSLLFLFLMERGSFSRSRFNEGNQKKDMVVQRKEVPSSIEPTETVSAQLVSPADAHLVTQNEPGVSRENGAHIAMLKEEGGSLYFLALKNYQKANATIYDLILQNNPTITDVRQIDDDQKITLPVITSESYIKKVSDGTYQVYVGTFKTQNLATLCAEKVINLGKTLVLDSHKFSSEDTWYRLMIGYFKSKEGALKTVNLLREEAIIYIPY
jgi:cell division protein FtsN